MKQNLYMIWNESLEKSEPILNEQHRAIYATINSLYYFLQQGHALEVLMPTIKIQIAYMRFHCKTEEGILLASEYPDIDKYITESEQIITDFKSICRTALIEREPEIVLQFQKKWWQDHLAIHEMVDAHILCETGAYDRIDKR